MKIDIHCNLPFPPTTPNPALSYLKAYLSSNKKFNVRGIYWNLLPLKLHNEYEILNSKFSKHFPYRNEIPLVIHISKYLYNENNKLDKESILSQKEGTCKKPGNGNTPCIKNRDKS